MAPRLVEHVLGDRWVGTETIIQLLAVVGIVGLLGDGTGPLFRGLGHPRWIFVVEVCQSGLVVALMWALTRRFGVIGAALAWLIATASAQMVSLILVERLLQNPLKGSALPVGSILIASVAGALVAIGVTEVVVGLAGLFLGVGAALATTLTVLWFCDQRFGLGLARDFSQAFPQVASLLGAASGSR